MQGWLGLFPVDKDCPTLIAERWFYRLTMLPSLSVAVAKCCAVYAGGRPSLQHGIFHGACMEDSTNGVLTHTPYGRGHVRRRTSFCLHMWIGQHFTHCNALFQATAAGGAEDSRARLNHPAGQIQPVVPLTVFVLAATGERQSLQKRTKAHWKRHC